MSTLEPVKGRFQSAKKVSSPFFVCQARINLHYFMPALPPAIIFINGDISYPPVPPPTPPTYIGAGPHVDELTTLQTQLYIDDTITKEEFDARVAFDPNYPTVVHLQGLRVLVILPTFQDKINRCHADIVMFLHLGLADVEENRFGPLLKSFDIQRLTIHQLLRAANSCDCIEVPMEGCNSCKYPFYCDRCHTFSGIPTCRGCQCECKCGCNIHAPNQDNEYHNWKFIHRK